MAGGYYMPVIDSGELLNDIAPRLDDGDSSDLWTNQALPPRSTFHLPSDKGGHEARRHGFINTTKII